MIKRKKKNKSMNECVNNEQMDKRVNKNILGKAQVYKCTKERLRKAQSSKHKPVKSRHLLQASGAYYPVIGKHKITLRNPMERNE